MAEGLNSKTMGMHAAEDSDKEIKKFQTFFNRLWNGSKPLARLFRTDQRCWKSQKAARCGVPTACIMRILREKEITAANT